MRSRKRRVVITPDLERDLFASCECDPSAAVAMEDAIALGADVNHQRYPVCALAPLTKFFRSRPLPCAVMSGHDPDYLSVLLQAGCSDGSAALGMWCAVTTRGLEDAFWLLSAAGAALDVPVTSGALTALHLEAEWGCAANVRRMLEAGARADVHSVGGLSPLQVACVAGRCDAVEVLLRFGADPHHRASISGGGFQCLPLGRGSPPWDRCEEEEERGGDTALHLACQAGCAPAVEMLLAVGCDVSAAGRCGDTPLHRAVLSGSLGVATEVVWRTPGKLLDRQNSHTETPLAVAVSLNNLRMARLLISAGCSRVPESALARATQQMARLVRVALDTAATDTETNP